ncbi:MAG: dihydrolipoamide acetyltransferase family protein [Nitrospirota bacterium]
MTDVIMPQMGESIAEGTISVWLVDKGQRVQENQPLVTVSTDKADVDIPSPSSGTLTEVLVQAGQTVKVGTLIARIDERIETQPDEAQPKPVEGVSGAELVRTAEAAGEKRLEAPPTKRDGPAEHPARPEGLPAAEAMRAPEAGVTPPTEIKREAGTAPGAEPQTGEDRAIFYSPAVMRLAAQYGIDLRQIKGTGEGGRVTKSDVQRHIAGMRAGAETDKPLVPPVEKRVEPHPQRIKPQGTVPQGIESPYGPETIRSDENGYSKIEESGLKLAGEGPATDTYAVETEASGQLRPDSPGFGAYRVPRYEIEDGDVEQEFSRLRRLIADHMVYSKRTAAHVTTFTQVDFDRIVGVRERNKTKIKQEMGISLTLLPFVMLASVRALREFPLMNSVVQGGKIITKKRINLGVAVDTERGLMVPVIRGAGEMGLFELARAVDEVSVRVRDRKVTADELAGGTFTVSNPGRHGNLFGTPIISQPQVGILRMGELVKRAEVIEMGGEDAIAIRPMMYLSLSYDHRVVDGLTANTFLHRIKEHLEKGEFGL